MKDDNCIFCKLANGIIPTNDIYEDDDFRVILDAEPASKGHALIIPKNHYADVFEADEKVLEKIMPLAKKVALKMKEALGCDGINILQNNGSEAGQTVFHLHVHLIPRYKGGNKMLSWSHESFSEEKTAEIRASLKL